MTDVHFTHVLQQLSCLLKVGEVLIPVLLFQIIEALEFYVGTLFDDSGADLVDGDGFVTEVDEEIPVHASQVLLHLSEGAFTGVSVQSMQPLTYEVIQPLIEQKFGELMQ